MIRSDNIRYFFIGLGLLAVQIVLLRHFEIFGAKSDIVLLYVLWLCSKRSKTACLIFAGLFGLLQDSLTDLWGLNMFSKTLLIFIVHGYLSRISERRLLFWQIFLIILFAATFHNSIFFVLSTFSEIYASGYLATSLIIISSLFTAVLGSFLHLVREDI